MSDTRLPELQLSLSALARAVADGKLATAPDDLLTRFEAAVAVMMRYAEDPHSRGRVRAAFLREREAVSSDEAVLKALLERVESGETTVSDKLLLEGIMRVVVCGTTTTRSICPECGGASWDHSEVGECPD